LSLDTILLLLFTSLLESVNQSGLKSNDDDDDGEEDDERREKRKKKKEALLNFRFRLLSRIFASMDSSVANGNTTQCGVWGESSSIVAGHTPGERERERERRDERERERETRERDERETRERDERERRERETRETRDVCVREDNIMSFDAIACKSSDEVREALEQKKPFKVDPSLSMLDLSCSSIYFLCVSVTLALASINDLFIIWCRHCSIDWSC